MTCFLSKKNLLNHSITLTDPTSYLSHASSWDTKLIIKRIIANCTFLSVIECEAPTARPGSTFSCSGSTTVYGGTCELTCEVGYTGYKTLRCNVDNNDGRISWDSMSKHCTAGNR